MSSQDSLNIEELKIEANLATHRDWFIKILKYADKLQDAINDEFLTTVNESQFFKEELAASKMRIMELERNNKDAPTQGADGDNSFEMPDGDSRAVIAELQDEKNNM